MEMIHANSVYGIRKQYQHGRQLDAWKATASRKIVKVMESFVGYRKPWGENGVKS